MTSKDRLLLNGQRILRVLREFSFESSGDVSINYIINNDGDETIYTMWSVRKIMDNLYGVIGSYFTKTYYIDGVNGDDDNDGSHDNPFKTLNKAVLSVGRNGYIYVLDDIEILASDNVNLVMKTITVNNHEDNTDAKMILNIDDAHYPIGLYKKSTFFCKIDLEIKNTYDETIRNAFGIEDNSSIYVNNRATDGNASLIFGNYTRVSSVRKSIACINNRDMTSSDNYNLFDIWFYASIDYASNTIDGDACDTGYYKDKTTGVARDADSGNPINLLSNYNLSD